MIVIPKDKMSVRKGVKKFKDGILKGKYVEITYKQPKRSLKQNNYWHLLIGFVATEMYAPKRYVSEYVFKELYNKDIFLETYTTKENKSFAYLKSSKDITDENMSIAIKRVLNGLREDTDIKNIPDPDGLKYEQEIYMRNKVEELKGEL